MSHWPGAGVLVDRERLHRLAEAATYGGLAIQIKHSQGGMMAENPTSTSTPQDAAPQKRTDRNLLELAEGEALLERLGRYKERPEIAAAMTLFSAAQEESRTARKQNEEAKRVLDKAAKGLKIADNDVDGEARGAWLDSQATLGLTRKTKAADPDFLVVFPEGIDFIYLPIPQEIEALKLFEDRINSSANAKGLGRARLGALVQKRQALEEAWKVFLAAEGAVGKMAGELRKQRALWKLARRRCRKRVEDVFAEEPAVIAEIFPPKPGKKAKEAKKAKAAAPAAPAEPKDAQG